MSEPVAAAFPPAQDHKPRAPSRRWMRLLVWLSGGLLTFGLLGYFAAPPLLKSVLLDQLSRQLHRQVSVDRIEINPYALSLRVAGMSIQAAGGREQAGFDELFVNLSSASLFRRALVVDEFRLRGWRVAVARLPDGRYDVSDLLDEWLAPKTEPDGPPPPFSLNNIQLADGRIEFDDQLAGRVHRISGIGLNLPFVSSLPYQAEIFVEPSLAAQIDGATLKLSGRSKPFASSHESELDLDLDHFDLAPLQAYLPAGLPLRLQSGIFDSELKAVFRQDAAQTFSLHLTGGLHLSNLAIADGKGQPLLAWKRLDVAVERIDPIKREFALQRVALDGLGLDLAVDAQGEMNVLAVLDRLSGDQAKPAPVAAAAPPVPPLRWSVAETRLDNGLLRWHDVSNKLPVQGEVRRLQARLGALDSSMAQPIVLGELGAQIDFGERLQIDALSLKDLQLDLAGRRIDIAEIGNRQTRLRLARNPAGQIEWITPPALKAAASEKPAAPAGTAKAPPWVVHLASLAVEDLGLLFDDKALQTPAQQRIEALNLTAKNLSNAPGRKGSLAISARINKKGSLTAEGGLQLVPLDLALKLKSVALPVMPLQPYFGEYLNVAVNRGVLSNQGEATLRLERDTLQAGYRGSLTLGDFLAVDRLNSSDFLKWKSLYFGGIDFRLQPLAVSIDEIALADFYSRLILNNEGRLNLADIVRQPASGSRPAGPSGQPGQAGTSGTPAPAVASAAATAASPTQAASAPVPIRIGKISLQNGTVNFSDFFVQPNYTVNLSKLGGRVSGLSSAEGSVADLELRGSYANAAPVQILAKLNPLAAKAFLDLKAEISGVDLVGFSPYAGKYAGYAIEKGKLSLNVAYKLENQKLAAENRLFIDQFTFGDKVESPDATKLPVNLAIALLKNSRGEIDLNLPIAGSLDDPEFSIGGLIVKVIVNLFVKAVTSPFALLGSLFGGGEEMSAIDFSAGRATLDAAALGRLQALARALNDRPALKLEITGLADPEVDREGLKLAALERAMKKEKAREMLKRSGEGASLENIAITPDEYLRYLTLAYKAAKFPKPRNAIGLLKELPQAEMEKLMLTNLPASDEAVRLLAGQRAETVQAWLVENGQVPLQRLFLLPSRVAAADTPGKGEKGEGRAKHSRVEFSLR